MLATHYAWTLSLIVNLVQIYLLFRTNLACGIANEYFVYLFRLVHNWDSQLVDHRNEVYSWSPRLNRWFSGRGN